MENCTQHCRAIRQIDVVNPCHICLRSKWIDLYTAHVVCHATADEVEIPGKIQRLFCGTTVEVLALITIVDDAAYDIVSGKFLHSRNNQ